MTAPTADDLADDMRSVKVTLHSMRRELTTVTEAMVTIIAPVMEQMEADTAKRRREAFQVIPGSRRRKTAPRGHLTVIAGGRPS